MKYPNLNKVMVYDGEWQNDMKEGYGELTIYGDGTKLKDSSVKFVDNYESLEI